MTTKVLNVDNVLKQNLEFLRQHAAKVAEAKAYVKQYEDVEERVKTHIAQLHPVNKGEQVICQEGVKTIAVLRGVASTKPNVWVSLVAVQAVLARPGGPELVKEHFEFKFVPKHGFGKDSRDEIERFVGPVLEYGEENVSLKLELV